MINLHFVHTSLSAAIILNLLIGCANQNGAETPANAVKADKTELVNVVPTDDPCLELTKQKLTKFPLYYEGRPAAEVVAEKRGIDDEVDKVLIDLGLRNSNNLEKDKEELIALLQKLDENPTITFDKPVPPALQGIGGFSTSMFLKMLLIPDVLVSEENPVVEELMCGKIRDYIYVAADQTAHLAVDVITYNKAENRQRYYHWDIEMAGSAGKQSSADFRILNRIPNDPTHPDYPDKPFPGLAMQMPDPAIDPSNNKSIWKRNLERKLHAKGNAVTVRKIYRQDLPSGALIELPHDPSDPSNPMKNHPLYMPTSDQCVDLFTPAPVPATILQLLDGDYCLGRCARPAIINTGGG